MNEIEIRTIEVVKNLLEPKLSQMFWYDYDIEGNADLFVSSFWHGCCALRM